MPRKHPFSVSLTHHFARFKRTETAAGRFSSASEVVRAGLRSIEDYAARRRFSARHMDGARSAGRVGVRNKRRAERRAT